MGSFGSGRFPAGDVVGDYLYVADEDGDIEVLRASAEYEFIGSMNHQDPIESSPIYAD